MVCVWIVRSSFVVAHFIIGSNVVNAKVSFQVLLKLLLKKWGGERRGHLWTGHMMKRIILEAYAYFFLLKYVCILLLHYWKQSNTDIAYFQTTSLLPGFLQFGGEVEENAKGVL